MNIEKISKYLLYGLLGVSALIWILFLLVGFNRQYDQDPNMNAPLLTDVIVIWGILLTVIAFVGMIWAYVMYLKQHGVERGLYFTWGIPICAIAIGLIVGFINKDQEFIYNLNDHASTSSLILSDTALIAVGIIALLAIAAILWSLVKRK
jgi:hypothetical protein